MTSLGCSQGDDASSVADSSDGESGASTDDSSDSQASTSAGTGDGSVGESASSSGGDESETDATTTGEPLSCAELPGPWHLGYSIPRADSPPGDPQAGLDALLQEDYVSCGIPWEMFALMRPFLGSFAGGPELDWREGKNAQVPVGWNVLEMQDGSEIVAPNCFNCHSAEFNGELVLGLGRHDADFTTDLFTLMQLVPQLPPLNDAGDAFNKFLERFSVVGPDSSMLTVGTNPAVEYALILVSHRNPYTLEWSEEPLQELPPDLHVPADPPPWWRAKKKASHFANGMSRGDHRGTMILASSLCTDSAAEASQIVGYFDDVQAYLESIEPPNYPLPVDEALAAEGAALFECHCQGCHGSYDTDDPEAEEYPNMLIPLEVIGTDPVFAANAAGDLNYLQEWFEESYFGTVTELATDDPFPGYVAPPLDAVWASAPYFHNGSVPSLELVLDSGARPTYWKRVDLDSTHYDWDELGWRYEAVPYGQDDAPLTQRRFIYDTTKPGHSGAGHTFGDALDDHERAAVLEYLKTI
ncbi:MAG: hypothetical protein H6713_01160 [Myxococcales bacterium]|nr:hypothetical protein [Myxococcales bacterium]